MGYLIETVFAYNLNNQLISVTKNNQITTYTYDPLGRRVSKQDNFGSTNYLWAGDQLAQEQRNNIKKTYVYEPESFKPVAMVQDGEIYHYHLDHLGTPRELTNTEGKIVWKAQYKTYGNVALKDVEEVENNLRFQGQYFDEETGLHYNRHRYYDPSVGQFTTQDPIGLLGGVNGYQYAPNPTGWVDPFGLTCKEALLQRLEESKKSRETSNFSVLTHQEKALEIQLKHQYGDISNAEIRQWYNDTVAVIPKMNDQWIRHKVDLETRAKNAHGIRHGARVTARDMMSDKAQVVELQARDLEKYQNPDGPTFEYLIAKTEKNGGEKEDAYEAIIGSANRTNDKYNKKFNVDKGKT